MLFVKYYKITHDSHDCGNKNMHSTAAASLLAFLKYSHTLLSICFLFYAILSKVFLYPQIITICCYCRCSSITQNIVKPQLWSTWIFIVVMGGDSLPKLWYNCWHKLLFCFWCHMPLYSYMQTAILLHSNISCIYSQIGRLFYVHHFVIYGKSFVDDAILLFAFTYKCRSYTTIDHWDTLYIYGTTWN